jgi:hypothetical protein
MITAAGKVARGSWTGKMFLCGVAVTGSKEIWNYRSPKFLLRVLAPA